MREVLRTLHLLDYRVQLDQLRACEIRDVEGKGKGIFAAREISANSIVLSEIPLMISYEIGTVEDPFKTAFDLITPAQQKSYQSLYAYRPGKVNWDLNRCISHTNGIQLDSSLKTGVFLLASRFNHSCVANTEWRWIQSITTKLFDRDGKFLKEEVVPGRMVFMTSRIIKKDEELTISYGMGPKHLEKMYGFRCNCGSCPSHSPEIMRKNAAEDRGEIERKRLAKEKEVLKKEWESDPALRRRRSLPS